MVFLGDTLPAVSDIIVPLSIMGTLPLKNIHGRTTNRHYGLVLRGR